MSPPRKNFLRLASFALLSALMLASILPAGRSLTGDAPVLLARARRLVDDLLDGYLAQALGGLASLVVPQPPLGYLMTLPAWLAGLERAAPLATSLLALGLVALGLAWLSEERRSPLGPAPLAALLLLFASPMTWSAAEHVQWDLLCAGWVALSLGALGRSEGLRHPRWTLLAGAAAAGAALVKYNAPLFLWLPLLAALLPALREGRRADAGRLVLAGALPLLLWAPLAAAELLPYLRASLAMGAGGTAPMDSASEVPPLADRLTPQKLAYYPAVLKDALGWPGLVACLAALPLAWRRGGAGARLALLSAVGGLVALSLVGRREPRYLLPALPLLLLAAELGWGSLSRAWVRHLVAATILLVGGAQLAGTARSYARWPEPTPLANLDFGPANLQRWGEWPLPEIAFVPTSSLAEEWRVPEAVEAIGQALGGRDGAVGFLLFSYPRVPQASLLVLMAAEQGWVWDRVELKLLSPHPLTAPPRPRAGPGGPPQAGMPGASPPPPPPPGAEEPSEAAAAERRRWEEEGIFRLHVDAGPARPRGDDAPPFEVLYAIHPRAEPQHGAFLRKLGGEEVAQFVLPRGFVGTVWRVGEEAWAGSVGQQVRAAWQGGARQELSPPADK